MFNYLYGFSPASFYGGNFYSCPTNAAYTSIPACDIYYNNNTTFDRQIAGFGEVSYAFTDWMKLTVGERIARTSFSLNHYADGYENYGPGPAAANEKETPKTPKATLSFQVDPKDLFYLTLRQGLPGRRRQRAAAVLLRRGPRRRRIPERRAAHVQVRLHAKLRDRLQERLRRLAEDRDQRLLHQVGSDPAEHLCRGRLRPAVHRQSGHGGGLGRRPTGRDEVRPRGHRSCHRLHQRALLQERPSGCQQSATAPPCLASNGDAISGQAAINYAPGVNSPFTTALGVQYNFRLAKHDSFVRADWEYESPQPWLAAVQDPNNNAQYNYGYSYTLPSTSFTSMRAGVNLGDWQLAAFCDNLFDSHTVTNYSLGQTDGTVTPQQNAYTFRPRTVGLTFTLRTH